MRQQLNWQIDHRLIGKKDLIDHIHECGLDVKSNHIYLTGEEAYAFGVGSKDTEEPGVEYVMANRFIKNMNLCMRISSKPVLIHMKTSGGDWNEGMAIYDMVETSKNPVTILNYTHARSMSSIILQSANKRVMMPHSHFMFHQGGMGIEGTTKQVTSFVRHYNEADRVMLEIYARSMKKRGELSHKSVNYIKSWLRTSMNKREDVYLSADRAVRLGLADEIFDGNWKKLITYTNQQLQR